MDDARTAEKELADALREAGLQSGAANNVAGRVRILAKIIAREVCAENARQAGHGASRRLPGPCKWRRSFVSTRRPSRAWAEVGSSHSS
jgi:hypothetical protein